MTFWKGPLAIGLVCGVLLAASGSANRGMAAGPQGGPSYRGDKRLVPKPAEAATPVEDGTRWALLIGVNDYGFATPLRFCVRDMEAYRDTLVRHGGYSEENVFLLVDQAADQAQQPTRGNIYNTLKRICDQAEENDTVLVAFSGHGELDDEGYAFLMPSDGSKESLSITGLPVSQIHDLLSSSRAQQKILIIDACHAGGKKGATSFAIEKPADIPSGEGFVELLSCRSDEVSWEDEEKQHGLFSHFLLDGIAEGKADRGTDGNRDGYVSVNEAMNYVERSLTDYFRSNRKYSGRSQTPVIRTREQIGTIVLAKVGAPDPGPVWDLSGDANLSLLTLPGLSGRWWFEDTPWLAPQIRPHVARLMPRSRSAARPIDGKLPKPIDGVYNPDIGQLQEQLAGAFSRYVAEQSFTRQRLLRRLRNLRWDELQDEEATGIVQSVSRLEDPHLLALVQHKLGLDGAGESYQDALRRYEDAANRSADDRNVALGLYALCLSDLGWWQFNQSQYRDAAFNFREARDILRSTQADTPLFDIVSMCCEAQAYRKLGDWRAVNETMAKARALADERLSDAHPLRAYVHERHAWALMDQWQCPTAAENFAAALQLRQQALERHLDADPDWTQISCFHNRHGLAMAKRFAGELDESRRQYAELLDAIARAVRGRPNADYAGRLVNTMERLADTYLFVHEPDADRAWMILGDAYDSTKYLAPDTRSGIRGQLLCKRAIAAALRGLPALVETQLNTLDALDLQDAQRDRLLVYRDVAEALAALEDKQVQTAEWEAARTRLRNILSHFTGDERPGGTTDLSAYGESRETLRREILELLLLAWDRLVLSQLDERASDEGGVPRAEDVAIIFDLVPPQFLTPAAPAYRPPADAPTRSAPSPILGFLRPYYTEGLRAELSTTKPQNVIYAIRHVKLATTGSDFFPRPYYPVLVPYLFDNEGYALCYRPGGENLVAPLGFGWQPAPEQAQGNTPRKLPDPVAAWIDRSSENVTVIWPEERDLPFDLPESVKVVDRF